MQAQARTSNHAVSFSSVTILRSPPRIRQRINALLSLLVIVSVTARPGITVTPTLIPASTHTYPSAQVVIGSDEPGLLGKPSKPIAINTPAIDSEYKLAAVPAAPRRGGPAGAAAAATPIEPDAPISFVLDDGVPEGSIGFGSTSERAAIWLNRFTPPTGSYPIALQNIRILWPAQSNDDMLIGQTARLLVYQDADGDGNPANATLVGSPITVTVGMTNSFQTYPVSVVAPGPTGDIYLGFEDYWAERGFTPRLFPAAQDSTTSHMRSWIAARSSGAAPNINNLGANNLLGTADSFGLPGNWLIRASGASAAPSVDECSVPNPVVACPVRHHSDTVNAAIGNFWRTYTDPSIPGRGVPLLFMRTYNSQSANTNGPLGYGWTHNYNMYVLTDTTTSEYKIFQENGSVAPFPTSGPPYPRVLANLTRNPDGSFVFTRTHGQDQFYFRPVDNTNVAKLYQIVDRNGYVTTLTYDTQGNVQTVTDPAGRTLSFIYGGGRLNRVRDSATPNRNVSFGYDLDNGDLMTFNDVGSQLTSFNYYPNGSHLLRTITDPNSGVVTNTYDSSNRVLSHTDPMNRSTQFGYAILPSGNTQTRITDTLNLVTLQEYETNKLIRSTQFPGAAQQAVWNYTYAPTLGVTSITDPNNHAWLNTWDLSGNLTSSTDPLSRATSYTYTYNSSNDLLVITNTTGLTTTYTYDNWGNVTSVSRPVTETNGIVATHYDYDQVFRGDVRTIIDPRGNKWQFTYNSYGYTLASSDPLGNTAHSTYDSVGNKLTSTDPNGHVTTFAYNAYNELMTIVDPLSYPTARYTYDRVGNRISVQDANGHVVTYVYDSDNEVTRVTFADNTHSDYTYDGLGRTRTQSNPLGETITYTYDDLNRRWNVHDPLDRSTEYIYDLAGRLASVRDGQGRLTNYGYDNANQLTGIMYADANTPDVVFSYNSRGLREQMNDGTGKTNYTYDSLDRLKSVDSHNNKIDGQERLVDYDYDLADNITRVGYPQRAGASRLNITRTFDPANRMDKLTLFSGAVSHFTYDPNGNLTDIDYSDRDRLHDVRTEIRYDAANRLDLMQHKQDSDLLMSLNYGRDSKGLVKAVDEFSDGGFDNHFYSYDTLDRLVGDDFQAHTPISSTWLYDPATQLRETSVTPAGGPTTATSRYYDLANQFTELDERQDERLTKHFTFTYDPNGNRTLMQEQVGGQQTSYFYDKANRLISLGGTGLIAPYIYKYNGDGLRQYKQQDVPYGRRDHFAWDIAEGLPLLLQDDHAHYVYGPGGMLLAEYYDIPVPDPLGPGSQATPQASPTATPTPKTPKASPEYIGYYYYLLDQQGSVRGLINEDGNQVEFDNYDAYGRRSQATFAGYNPFGYTGQYTDSESGLLYMRARYYDPTTEQFINRDPMEGSSGQPYAYAGGSPTNATDPSGNCPICPFLIVAAIGIGSAVAVDAGINYVSDPNDFDLWSSIGGSLSDPGTYLAALPGEGEISVVVRAAAKGAGKRAVRSVVLGPFSIRDWKGYPTGHGVPRPEGPFGILEGQAYKTARNTANNANKKLRQPGMEIHEIHPVKFGGSPTDLANKIPLSGSTHDLYTAWWNALRRNLTGK